MRTGIRETVIKSLRPSGSAVRSQLRADIRFAPWFYIFSFLVLVCFSSSICWAVTSKITRHSSSADLLSGEAEDVVISSRGTFQLGRAWEALVEEFEDVWSINSIVVSGGTIFFGTSPNGGIYKYSLGELTKIYPVELETESTSQELEPNDANDANEPGDANVVEAGGAVFVE
ncbi:MAG: hypothetical protein ACYS30_25475 [Planctomycetota bacterium]|jgi:hypothetical protein